MKPLLLFITNLDHEDREEDLFLIEKLSEKFQITVTNPEQALLIIKYFSHCIIRNAWPSRIFKDALKKIHKRKISGKIKIYNSINRTFIENKSYLISLYESSYPTIPTYLNTKQMLDNGYENNSLVLLKPVDGCSSWGILKNTLGVLVDVSGYILQPIIDFKYEISLFFIDGAYTYSVRSKDKENRWELIEFIPSRKDIAWAKRFILWNSSFQYGIQRIDAMRLHDDSLLLVEIEDSMCYLSLLQLGEGTRTIVIEKLSGSILRNLFCIDNHPNVG